MSGCSSAMSCWEVKWLSVREQGFGSAPASASGASARLLTQPMLQRSPLGFDGVQSARTGQDYVKITVLGQIKSLF